MRVLLKQTGPHINVRTLFFRNPHLLTNHNSIVTRPKLFIHWSRELRWAYRADIPKNPKSALIVLRVS